MDTIEIKKKILSTILYYDILDYPLTHFEIWKLLTIIDSSEREKKIYVDYKLIDILNTLEDKELKKKIGEQNGFYFLRGRDFLVEQRIARMKQSELKLRRLRQIIKFIRIVPFIRGILVTGRLAMKNIGDRSDWDLIIITKPGRIWLARTVLTFFLHITKTRRHKKFHKDRICLNYFITTDSLEIERKDLFAANEYLYALPILHNAVCIDFQKANMQWIKKFKPHFEIDYIKNIYLVEDNFLTKIIRKVFEIILNNINTLFKLEERLAKMQIKKIENNPNTKLPGAYIVANKDCLIFLPKPHSPIVEEKFRQHVNRFLDS